MKTPLFTLLCFLLCSAAQAQVGVNSFLTTGQSEKSPTNYFYAKPNELTHVVSVVGFVQRPGRYEVSTTIDVYNLLALAGGPSVDGTLSDIRITRFAEVDGKIRWRELRLNLEDLTGMNPQDLKVLAGDIIRVERSGWSGFRDALVIVGAAALVVSATAQMMYATKR
jgi:hypothetical protein